MMAALPRSPPDLCRDANLLGSSAAEPMRKVQRSQKHRAEHIDIALRSLLAVKTERQENATADISRGATHQMI